MKAVMLAAGVARRLYGDADGHPHKALLRFAGRSLLARHIDVLGARQVDELVIVVGYQAEALQAEVERIGAGGFVRLVYNPDFRLGSLLSLWQARAWFDGGDDLLVMDADVLYHPGLIDRLIRSPHADCLLLDRDFEPGEEPVKLCIRDDRPVEFAKLLDGVPYDFAGEWPGFLKLSPATAVAFAEVMRQFVDRNALEEPMEEAVRELIRRRPGALGWEDVTGLPWIEIDFPADVVRANERVLPRIEAAVPPTSPQEDALVAAG